MDEPGKVKYHANDAEFLVLLSANNNSRSVPARSRLSILHVSISHADNFHGCCDKIVTFGRTSPLSRVLTDDVALHINSAFQAMYIQSIPRHISV